MWKLVVTLVVCRSRALILLNEIRVASVVWNTLFIRTSHIDCIVPCTSLLTFHRTIVAYKYTTRVRRVTVLFGKAVQAERWFQHGQVSVALCEALWSSMSCGTKLLVLHSLSVSFGTCCTTSSIISANHCMYKKVALVSFSNHSKVNKSANTGGTQMVMQDQWAACFRWMCKYPLAYIFTMLGNVFNVPQSTH